MKNLVYNLLTAAALMEGLTGCVNPDGTQNNTASGALIGGGLGALTGAAIGGSRHGGQDALIGAGIGALAGGLFGNAADRERDARLRASAPPPAPNPMSIADVKALVRSGVSDDVIITQIQTTHSIFHLTASEIIDLRDSGVSDRLTNFMINSPNTVTPLPAPVVVPVAPPAPPAEVYVTAPGPDYVWVGGEWSWDGVQWVWVGGHWILPPRPHAVWVAGYRWHDRYGWHYSRGYWR